MVLKRKVLFFTLDMLLCCGILSSVPVSMFAVSRGRVTGPPPRSCGWRGRGGPGLPHLVLAAGGRHPSTVTRTRARGPLLLDTREHVLSQIQPHLMSKVIKIYQLKPNRSTCNKCKNVRHVTGVICKSVQK